MQVLAARSTGRLALSVRSAPASLPLAVALPLVFLHVDYQPGFTVHVGSADAHVVLSDVVVLAVAVVGLAVGRRRGFAPLRCGIPIWVAGGLLLAMVTAASLYPRLWDPRYQTGTHFVTAAKYSEYALLAVATPLLVRSRRDLKLLLTVLVAWTVVAAAVSLMQILGVSIFEAWRAGYRQPSFLGHEDFAVMSGTTLAVALIGLAMGRREPLDRIWLVAAGVAGTVGVVVAADVSAGIGVALAAGAIIAFARRRSALTGRRLAAILSVVAIVGCGIFLLRGRDFNQFLRFVGIRAAEHSTKANVQTYGQRTILLYLGARIFLSHPVAGVGWQGSSDYRNDAPYLAAARRRFPNQPPLAFPSLAHPWGVQNAYVQALADMGVIGFLLFAGLLGTGLRSSWRTARSVVSELEVWALVPLVGLLVAIGGSAALGLVAGIPLDALLWLSLGLSVTVAAIASSTSHAPRTRLAQDR